MSSPDPSSGLDLGDEMGTSLVVKPHHVKTMLNSMVFAFHG